MINKSGSYEQEKKFALLYNEIFHLLHNISEQPAYFNVYHKYSFLKLFSIHESI